MLTRKDFIKKANELIEQLHNVKRDISKESFIVNDINKYCELAIISNPRFDRGRFNDYITKGLYEKGL